MKQLLTSSIIFCIGLALAVIFAFVFLGEPVRSSALSANASNAATEEKPLNSGRLELKSPDKNLQSTTESKTALPNDSASSSITDKEPHSNISESPAQRRAMLREAVRSLEPLNLQLLSPASLKQYPEHRILLGQLRHDSLESMLSRFSRTDWELWPQSGTAVGGGPTPARAYVDRIFAANSEVGRFLETAALLLHRLYVATRNGISFDAEMELTRIERNAEALFGLTGSSLPAKARVEVNILEDPGFRDLLSRTKFELTTRYIEENPHRVTESISLILSLPAADVSKELRSRLVGHIAKTALKGSAGLRRSVSNILSESRETQTLAQIDSSIRRVLAEFYLVVALDYLESSDLRTATAYYSHSTELAPDLRANEIVKSALLSVTNRLNPPDGTAKEPAKEVPSTPANSESDSLATKSFGTSDSLDRIQAGASKLGSLLPEPSKASGRGASFLVTTFLFIIVATLTGFVFLYRRGLRSVNVVAFPNKKTVSSPKPTSSVRLTSPTEMDFEQERSVANS